MPQKSLTEIWYEMHGFSQERLEKRLQEWRDRDESVRRVIATVVGILLILAYVAVAYWIADLEKHLDGGFNWPLVLGVILTIGIALMPIPAYRFVYPRK